MGTIVLSLGGSVITSADADISYLTGLSKLLEQFTKEHTLYVVIGGGTTARSYIQRGRDLGYTEDQLDEIGIACTRVNAQLMSYSFSDANKRIPTTTDDAKDLPNKIVFMGGTTPGHSTDMVGAELAAKTGAQRFIIATNVDGIYTDDPRTHPEATKYDTVNIDKLIKNLGIDWKSAGKNAVIDGPALKIIKDSRIPTSVINGADLVELENALTGKTIKGTIVDVG